MQKTKSIQMYRKLTVLGVTYIQRAFFFFCEIFFKVLLAMHIQLEAEVFDWGCILLLICILIDLWNIECSVSNVLNQ